MQQLLILYEIETVSFAITDKNTQAQSYTHLQVDIPLYCTKFRNIDYNKTTGTKDMQKNRLWALLQGTLHSETEV